MQINLSVEDTRGRTARVGSTVSLEPNPKAGYALSVTNDGRGLRVDLTQPPTKDWE